MMGIATSYSISHHLIEEKAGGGKGRCSYFRVGAQILFCAVAVEQCAEGRVYETCERFCFCWFWLLVWFILCLSISNDAI
jgi:hypothetical protein